MSCQRFEEWLALEVGGDLGANEAAKLQVHLGQCEACNRFGEGLRGAVSSQTSAPRLRPTSTMRPRLYLKSSRGTVGFHSACCENARRD